MTDYANGKIYRIGSNQIEKYYIGSTCDALEQRLSEHKSRYNQFTYGTEKYNLPIFEITQHADVYIELIELFPCQLKEELLRREGELIRLNIDDVVNKNIAGRTYAEYYADNKEKIVAYQKKYDLDHPEQTKTKQKKYYDTHTEEIAERKKINREVNGEAMNEARREQWAENSEANNIKQREYRSKTDPEITKANNKRSNDKRAEKKKQDKANGIVKVKDPIKEAEQREKGRISQQKRRAKAKLAIENTPLEKA